uniref:Lysophospholipid acyltransferase (Trinotate prediction) n=1 Tax=Henneguya salminicola TaxID=69463 RepID=A0A6G3MGS3_HENSL
MISWIAELTNISPDKLLALLYLLINYPFAYILNYLIYFDLGPPIIKHLFVICVSLAILVNIFSWLCFQTLFLIVISYLVIKLAKNKDVGAIVTVFSLVYLGIFHFLRMFTSRESNHLTITTVTMLVVQRVTFYAYYIKEQRDKLKEYEDFEKPAIKYASFIEFLSYCLFFPVLLFGPSCDYAHYQQAISGLFVSTYIRDYGKGPSVRLNTIQPFFMSIFSLAAYVVVDFYFPFVYLVF